MSIQAEHLDKLAAARRLVQEVRDDMDDATRKCPCCELRVAENYDELQQARQLDSVVGKLGKIEDQIRGHMS